MAGNWYTLGLDVSGFTSGISSAMAGLSKFGLAVDGVQKGMAIARAGMDALAKPVQLAAEFEATQMAIRTIVGDLKVADALMAQVEKYADTTSFEFPELASTVKMLLGMGTAAGDIMGELRMMGDLAAGLNQPIESFALVWGQARASVQLMGGDMMQLNSKGVSAYKEIAEYLNLTVQETKKLGEAGQLEFPLLQEAFRRLTSEGGKFHDMTAKQSRTTLGLWSTLNDGVNRLYRQLGTPINDVLRPLMAEINEKHLPELSKKFAITLEAMKAAASKGKLGEFIGDSVKLGLIKAAQFGQGVFEWLPKVLETGLSNVAGVFTGEFSKNGLDAVVSFGRAMYAAIKGSAKLLISELGSSITDVAAWLHAAIDLAGDVYLTARGQLDPSERKTWDQRMQDGRDMYGPDALKASAKEDFQKGADDLEKSIRSLGNAAVDIAREGKAMPQFKVGDFGAKEARLYEDRIASQLKEGAAAEAAKTKANEEAAKALDKTKTSAEAAADALSKAKATAKAGAAAESSKGGGSGPEYKSWREQRADALADRRARFSARASRGFSALNIQERVSEIDKMRGTMSLAKQWAERDAASPMFKAAGSSFGSMRDRIRATGRRGQAVAAGVAEEGRRAGVAARVARRQDAPAENSTDRLLGQLVATVQGMQRAIEGKLGVA